MSETGQVTNICQEARDVGTRAENTHRCSTFPEIHEAKNENIIMIHHHHHHHHHFFHSAWIPVSHWMGPSLQAS